MKEIRLTIRFKSHEANADEAVKRVEAVLQACEVDDLKVTVREEYESKMITPTTGELSGAEHAEPIEQVLDCDDIFPIVHD